VAANNAAFTAAGPSRAAHRFATSSAHWEHPAVSACCNFNRGLQPPASLKFTAHELHAGDFASREEASTDVVQSSAAASLHSEQAAGTSLYTSAMASQPPAFSKESTQEGQVGAATNDVIFSAARPPCTAQRRIASSPHWEHPAVSACCNFNRGLQPPASSKAAAHELHVGDAASADEDPPEAVQRATAASPH